MTGSPPGPAAGVCPFCGTSREQLHVWEQWLERTLARERAYLDRRKRRGVRTPTDDVLEEDQRHLQTLLQVIRRARACAPLAGAFPLTPAGQQEPPLRPSCSSPEEGA
ncbi:hypothetical protein [Thermogemmatispora sp.]|uniref:hypothetical protein n=1 Tax=Thermogemmatispora sp. TaxID=1968838 RepID=UPI0035E42E26